MWHNPFHTYSPPNYQPNAKPDPEVIIPARVIKLAIDSGGEFIHPSGDSIYKWTYDRMHVAWWNGSNFGSWFEWTKEEIPTGVLKPL